jgi:hypothetical protein
VTLYRGYVGAGHACSGGPTPGARALMSWFLGAFDDHRARNDGIYNCRPVRGGTTPSVHGEGRADDLGCQAGAEWAQELADLLVKYSFEVGIQCVIYARHIWSGAHPDAGWRPYGGVDAHTTHLHVELSKKAAAGLTVPRIQQVLGPHLIDDDSAPAQIPEDLMAKLDDDDIEKIAAWMWTRQTMTLSPATARALGDGAVPGGPVSAGYLLQYLVRGDTPDTARDQALKKVADDLAVTVAQLGRNAGTGGLDPDRFAKAVADQLKAELPESVVNALVKRLES